MTIALGIFVCTIVVSWAATAWSVTALNLHSSEWRRSRPEGRDVA